MRTKIKAQDFSSFEPGEIYMFPWKLYYAIYDKETPKKTVEVCCNEADMHVINLGIRSDLRLYSYDAELPMYKFLCSEATFIYLLVNEDSGNKDTKKFYQDAGIKHMVIYD